MMPPLLRKIIFYLFNKKTVFSFVNHLLTRMEGTCKSPLNRGTQSFRQIPYKKQNIDIMDLLSQQCCQQLCPHFQRFMTEGWGKGMGVWTFDFHK